MILQFYRRTFYFFVHSLPIQIAIVCVQLDFCHCTRGCQAWTVSDILWTGCVLIKVLFYLVSFLFSRFSVRRKSARDTPLPSLPSHVFWYHITMYTTFHLRSSWQSRFYTFPIFFTAISNYKQLSHKMGNISVFRYSMRSGFQPVVSL